MDKRLERILPRVQKPARYTGGEYNQILKDRDAVELRLAFCFPDTYEIGMSNLGMSILYQTMNSLPFVWCERVFAPWGDMYAEMKQAGIPLYALESGESPFPSVTKWPIRLCWTCWTWRACPCAVRSVRLFSRWSGQGARRLSTPSRWRPLSTCSSSARARRSTTRS